MHEIPSIPHPLSSDTSAPDLQLKSQVVQTSDVQKEAHQAYSMASVNDGNPKIALKHWKRFYFCSKLLEDAKGMEVALNRVGITYFKLGKLVSCLKFHKKHEEQYSSLTAIINVGIAYRV